jgi:hypothetical protein
MGGNLKKIPCMYDETDEMNVDRIIWKRVHLLAAISESSVIPMSSPALIPS